MNYYQQFEKTSSHIQKIVKELYPVIQYQFVLTGSYSNFENRHREDPTFIDLWVLINELRSIFYTLTTYEIKLVFPSVLRYFDNEAANGQEQLPDIFELLSMIQPKEKLLLKLCEEIDARLQKMDSNRFPQKENIKILISLFQNEFRKEKEQWNKMLFNRTLNGICSKAIQVDLQKIIFSDN